MRVSADHGRRSPYLEHVPPSALPGRHTKLPTYDVDGRSLTQRSVGVGPERCIRTSSEARQKLADQGFGLGAELGVCAGECAGFDDAARGAPHDGAKREIEVTELLGETCASVARGRGFHRFGGEVSGELHGRGGAVTDAQDIAGLFVAHSRSPWRASA